MNDTIGFNFEKSVTWTTEKDIQLKLGVVIPKGSSILVTWDWEGSGRHYSRCAIQTLVDKKTYIIRSTTLACALGLEVPSFDSIATDEDITSVLGEVVEPDGVDHYGSPSWLLAYGLI